MYRTYELQVNGGAPYEQHVAVEASVTKECMRTQEPANLYFFLPRNIAMESDLMAICSIFLPLFSSDWCFPADAPRQAAAQTHCQAEIDQQSHQGSAEVGNTCIPAAEQNWLHALVTNDYQ